MNRARIKKSIGVILGVLFIACTFLSASIVYGCMNHEHDHSGPGGGCAVCAQLAASESLLKSMSLALVAAAVIGECFAAFLSASRTVDFPTDFSALVCLKTRLNC